MKSRSVSITQLGSFVPSTKKQHFRLFIFACLLLLLLFALFALLVSYFVVVVVVVVFTCKGKVHYSVTF